LRARTDFGQGQTDLDEGKRAIILHKGLKAATVLGGAFRGQNAVEDQSGADVKTGLNTSA
jgi:hypothetical protein